MASRASCRATSAATRGPQGLPGIHPAHEAAPDAPFGTISAIIGEFSRSSPLAVANLPTTTAAALVRCVLRSGAMSDSDHRRIRLLVALLTIVVGPAASGSCLAMGEAPAPTVVAAAMRAMTLDEALRYARNHQPSLQSALARVAAAAADRRVARAQWLPAFGATLQAIEGTTNNSTASYIGVREVALPRIGGTPIRSTGTFTPSTSTLAALGAGQEVFDFGRIAAQAAVADVAYETEQYRAGAERLRVELLVKEAYFAVHGARAVLRAAEDAYARAQVHRDIHLGTGKDISQGRAKRCGARFRYPRARPRQQRTRIGKSLRDPLHEKKTLKEKRADMNLHPQRLQSLQGPVMQQPLIQQAEGHLHGVRTKVLRQRRRIFRDIGRNSDAAHLAARLEVAQRLP